ncbi:MAG: hypothetical protein AVDCRST_MAG77-1315 [uncultured Chloroflexi bacterium]|uniref:Uncharacterized protein n=1 Tax=uncultured Chloroflexota bacterium TaxID=166587 RepID=A0A6J4HUX5_9CHLR|nr:MAG: hypothetical protein AVDCRST_MAG77-1315 [uncultured Chloroflexota bacterium]
MSNTSDLAESADTQENGEDVAPAASARDTMVSVAELEDLGKRYAMDSDLADALRAGFREVKRAPGEAKRLGTLLHGLARKHESDAHHTAEEVGRVIGAIQRQRGEE